MGWALLALLVSCFCTLAMGAAVLGIVRAERTGASLELLRRVESLEERLGSLLDLVIEQEKRLANPQPLCYSAERYTPAPPSWTTVPRPKEVPHAGPQRDQV